MRISTGAVDWSGQTAEEVQVEDLDPVEIARARNILHRINPASELLKLDDQGFLVGVGAIRQGRVTHTGVLLFGREQRLSELCP
jgi:ATP-dependent DNA helicase RecG